MATYLLNTFHIRNQFYPFGLGIAVGNVVAMLQIVVVGALALRRFVRTQVVESLTRQAAKKDLEQAQQLQQRVLVPEIVHSSVFSVESEYRPAQTVGGDFFQTLTKPDGSLLVVIGDVSGKGVSAAMLVAVLVGAIRNQAEYSLDPALMLATLNRRMVGRSGGHFATCLAAELSPSWAGADCQRGTHAAVSERQGTGPGGFAAAGHPGRNGIPDANRSRFGLATG